MVIKKLWDETLKLANACLSWKPRVSTCMRYPSLDPARSETDELDRLIDSFQHSTDAQPQAVVQTFRSSLQYQVAMS